MSFQRETDLGTPASAASETVRLTIDGRDVTVVLRDDVWQVFGGTLSLTRTQAQMLRLHLNELNAYQPLDDEPEDG
jgi:hypothetical protein